MKKKLKMPDFKRIEVRTPEEYAALVKMAKETVARAHTLTVVDQELSRRLPSGRKER